MGRSLSEKDALKNVGQVRVSLAYVALASSQMAIDPGNRSIINAKRSNDGTPRILVSQAIHEFSNLLIAHASTEPGLYGRYRCIPHIGQFWLANEDRSVETNKAVLKH